jgi:hypothetical protein
MNRYSQYAYPSQAKVTELVKAKRMIQVGKMTRSWKCVECGEAAKDSGNIASHILRMHG